MTGMFNVLFKGTTDYLDQCPKLRFNASNEFSIRFKEIASETPALVAAMATSLGVDKVKKLDQVEIINQAASTRIAKQLNPSLFNTFLEYLDDRIEENPDGKIAALYYNNTSIICDYDSYPEDEIYDESECLIRSEYANVNHIHLMDLICKTGAFPIDSSQTLDLVAMCAFLASRFPELAADYFKALTLYISRRHDLETRKKNMEYETKAESDLMHFKLADDITMLWTFFWIFVLAANQQTLLPSVNPMEFISTLQSSRPLFNIASASYTKRLERCTTPFQLANVFLVYGNSDIDREKECSDAFHTYYRREKGEEGYSKTVTDASFEKVLNLCRANGVFSLETDRFHAGFQDELEKLALLSKEYLLVNVTADIEYCSKYVLSIPTDRPVIAIKSACGTGKSVQMLQYIDSMDDTVAIVFITHRKALSAEIQKRTLRTKKGLFELYSNIDGAIDLNQHRYLICEYESLSRIQSYKGPICVIIDEVNSVLNQTQSSAGDSQAAHMVFSGLMQHAHRVLLMDAFLDLARINVIRSYVKTEPYVIVNTYKPNTDHEIWHTSKENSAKQKLLSLLEQGENVIVPCVMKKQAEEIYHLVCSVLNPNEVQLYTSESRWQNGDDVNEVWSKARVVIYTATMDSGHSFEFDHFGWAVCFFSNSVAIPVEACLQMKARSRQTRRFLMCIEQRHVQENPIMSSIESIVANIHKNQRQLANDSCERYFGSAAYWGRFGGEEYPICPFLMLHATVQMQQYISARHYTRLMYEMLIQDGVQEVNIRELEDDGQSVKEAVKQARKEAKDNAHIPTPFQLAQIYTETNIGVFASMDGETRRFYGERKISQAYKNRLLLHSEGVKFSDSVHNLEKKEKLVATALAVCRSTGKFDENSILNTEIQLGIHVEEQPLTSVAECFRIACRLCEMFTGQQNPLDVGRIDGSKIRQNLMCTLREPNNVPQARLIYDINAELSREIEIHHRRYLLRSCNQGYHSAKNKILSVTEGITLLNEVLQRQFAMKLQRTNKKSQDSKQNTRQYIYQIDDSFSQCNIQEGENLIHQNKPNLTPWSTDIAPPKDEEILSYKSVHGKNIVCLGSAFEKWIDGFAEHRNGYKQMKSECLGTKHEHQKRKIEHDICCETEEWSKLSDDDKQRLGQQKQEEEAKRELEYAIKKQKSNETKLKKQQERKSTQGRRRCQKLMAKGTRPVHNFQDCFVFP